MINLQESMGPGRDGTRGTLDLQSELHLLSDMLPSALHGLVKITCIGNALIIYKPKMLKEVKVTAFCILDSIR